MRIEVVGVRSEEGGVRIEVVGVRSEELGRRGTACRALGEEGGCLVGLLFFAPVTSRVSPRRASYFFLLRQKKVTKKKASHVRAASRSLALLAAFGTLANSLRSNSASVLIRTLLRCSARPNGGGIPHGSSASRTSPRLLVRCAHFAGVGLPHFSRLTSLKGTARRAPTCHPLTPHSSLLVMGNHKGCPYALSPHKGTARRAPTTSPLTPTTSLLTPHSSLLRPPQSARKPDQRYRQTGYL